MGRRDNMVQAPHPALAALAVDLRRLRVQAGSPPYRTMAIKASYSASSLSEAASGRRLPSKAVVIAYAQACGADPAIWAERWDQVAMALSAADEEAAQAVIVDQGGNAAASAKRGRWSGLNPRRVVTVVAASVLLCTGLAVFLGTTVQERESVVADGQDPYIHGCGHDQQPMERQPIYRPNGRAYGYVVLFYSRSCAAAWGYVLGPNSPSWKVYVAAHRMDDGREAVSSFQGAARPNSWGNVMSVRSGCVRAEAWIDAGPHAVTSCWRDGGTVIVQGGAIH